MLIISDSEWTGLILIKSWYYNSMHNHQKYVCIVIYSVLSANSVFFSTLSGVVRKVGNNSATFVMFFPSSNLEYNPSLVNLKDSPKFLLKNF